VVFIGAGLSCSTSSPGGAILVLAAVAVTALLLLRRPTRWPFPAGVPALVLIGLGGLWPALAGRASSAWERLVLGALGWLWLVTGAFLAGQAGYVRLPAQTPPPRVWMPSLYDTVHQVLHQLVYSGILAPALVWGAGALVLPWVTARPAGGHEPARRIVRGALLLAWAATVALLTRGLLSAVDPGAGIRSGELVVGALVCAVLAGVRRPALLRRPVGQAQTPGRDSRSMETR
jgi:hypothetical protein